MTIDSVLRRLRPRAKPLPSSKISGQEGDGLIELLRQKLRNADLLDDRGEKFLSANLAPRLSLYVWLAPRLKVRYRRLAFVVAASGLASSVIAALGHASGHSATLSRDLVIALGLAVGLLTQLLQITRPAERSVAYYHARASLLHEGWDFVYDDGVYAAHARDPHKQFSIFREQILRIEAAAAAIDEQTESAPTHRRTGANDTNIK